MKGHQLSPNASRTALRTSVLTRSSDRVVLSGNTALFHHRGASTGGFRSPVVQKKHSLVVEFRSTLHKASRWRKTEAVLQLLEKLASEDGFYRSEMQLVVAQLQQDLFCDLSALPESIQKAVGNTHLEAYLTRRVPYHVVADAMVEVVQSLESSLKGGTAQQQARDAEHQRSLQSLRAEVESLEKQLRAALEVPQLHEDRAQQARAELAVVLTHLKQADEWITKLRDQKHTLQRELTLKAEQYQHATEDLSAVNLQVSDLQTALEERERLLERSAALSSALESRCSEALARLKMAKTRIDALEQQVVHSQNECIRLRERAAVAFDELTPRPDWNTVSISQLQGLARKSSKECLTEVAHSLSFLKQTAVPKIKTKRLGHAASRGSSPTIKPEDFAYLSVPASPTDN